MGHGDNVAALVRLVLVTDDDALAGRDPAELAAAAERGGATAIQVRLKRATARELADVTRRVVAAVQVPVLVNDRPDVALAAGAHGVHLGNDDLPVADARRVLPPRMIVGASVGSTDEVAGGKGADYWGVGPWRLTTTKPDAGSALGSGGFAAIVQLAAGIPCIAIGAVDADDVPEVLSAGGAGVAVVSAVLGAADPTAATRRIADRFG